jgi:hypothetical protein
MSYYITTFCHGSKYEPIKNKWLERIYKKCRNCNVKIYENINIHIHLTYAWWDVVRLSNNLSLLLETQKPIVQLDIDAIIEKDIERLVELNYDFIISTEIGGDKAFPQECSKKLGFGVCSGFYIIKPSAYTFLYKILSFMNMRINNNYSDQVNIMTYIVNNNYDIKTEDIVFDNITYTNKIIHIDGITICVLDFDIVTRDPIVNKGQFVNHINIDNVGGVDQFLRYFDEPLESLPLTCRCGKAHLGDTNICKHKELRTP